MYRRNRKLFSTEWEQEPPAQTIIQSMQESERITNVIMGRTMLGIAIACLIVWFLNSIGVYQLSAKETALSCWGVFVLGAALFCLAEFSEGRAKHLRLILTISYMASATIATLSSINTLFPYMLLLMLTSGYSRRRFTIILSFACAAEMTMLSYFGAKMLWERGAVDLSYFYFPNRAAIMYKGWQALNLADYMTAKDYALAYISFKSSLEVMALIVCGICCYFVADRNYRVLVRQHMRDEQRSSAEIELSRNKAALLESNSRLLVSQIQPHFVYNVLNTIYHLCDLDSEKAQEAVSDFSDYLRTNLCVLDGNATVPFHKERQHIETYLRLEKMRFGERLNVCWDVETEDFNLPELGLQPLVENAVKHGICKRREGGTVTVSTRETEHGYQIQVLDDGVGFNSEQVIGSDHVGIRNVRSRLEILCHATLTVESEPGQGTTVTITIPKEAVDENTGH